MELELASPDFSSADVCGITGGEVTDEACVEELSCDNPEETVDGGAASATPVTAEPGDDTDTTDGEYNDESEV